MNFYFKKIHDLNARNLNELIHIDHRQQKQFQNFHQ